MQVYVLEAATLSDVLALICAPTLTISANNAHRVAELQALLRDATANPQDMVSALEFGIIHEKLAERIKECEDNETKLVNRDAAIRACAKQFEEHVRERALLGDTVAAQAEALESARARLAELEELGARDSAELTRVSAELERLQRAAPQHHD